MSGIFAFILYGTVAAAIYFMTMSVASTSDRRTRRILKNIRASGRRKVKKSGRDEEEVEIHIAVLSGILVRLVRISEDKKERVERKLKRAGFRYSAKEFYANAAAHAAYVFLLVPVFFMLNITVAAVACFALGITVYYKQIGKLEEVSRTIQLKIADELPRFVSVVNYSMSSDRDLIRTVEKYLRICKPAFRYDLELLLLEMKGGNSAEALKRFDLRVDIPQLSAFVSGLIDADRGIDQKTFFYIMEENMKQLFVENKKKEMTKRPAKIKKAIVAAGLCLFMLYLVPITLQLLESLKMFNE